MAEPNDAHETQRLSPAVTDAEIVDRPAVRRAPAAEPAKRPVTLPMAAIGLIAVVAVAGWTLLANWLPMNDLSRDAVLDRHPVPLRPADWTWWALPATWIALIVFMTTAFFPSGRNRTRIRTVAPLYAVAALADVAGVAALHLEEFRLSLIALVVATGMLATIFGVLRTARRTTERLSSLQRMVIAAPFAMATAWSLQHTALAVQIWQKSGAWSGGPFGLRGWAIVILLTGVMVGAVVSFTTTSTVFPLMLAWFDAGVAVRQWDDARTVSIVAGVAVAALLAIVVMTSLMSFGNNPSGTTTPPESRSRLRWRRDTSSGVPPEDGSGHNAVP